MSSQRKTILTATLGSFVKPDAAMLAKFGGADNVKQAVATSVEQAKEAGFDVSNIALNPADVDETLKGLESQLKSQHWDGFLIGFMIRGNKDYSVLFEGAVNLSRKVSPETTLLFGTSPVDLITILQRNFPGAE